jgi:hypothetical protein
MGHWFYPTLAECPWALLAMKRLNERERLAKQGQFDLPLPGDWDNQLRDQFLQEEWLVEKYLESGNSLWLAIGQRLRTGSPA